MTCTKFEDDDSRNDLLSTPPAAFLPSPPTIAGLWSSYVNFNSSTTDTCDFTFNAFVFFSSLFFFFISFPLYISPGDKAFIGLAIHHYASLTRRCPDKLNVYPANFRPIIDNDYPPPRQYFERKSLLFARTCVAYMVDSLTRYPKTISMLCRSRIAKSLRTINVMSDAIPLDSKFPVDAFPYD